MAQPSKTPFETPIEEDDEVLFDNLVALLFELIIVLVRENY